MCEQCVEINRKIDRYRLIASRTTDQTMLDGIEKLIDELQAAKVALHPVTGASE
jgi:hypothetical protein